MGGQRRHPGGITELELALYPLPEHRVLALLGFAELPALLAAGETLRTVDGVRALELLDGRGLDLAEHRLGLPRPTRERHPWYLLVEVGGDLREGRGRTRRRRPFAWRHRRQR
ncbi:FAD-linked oxidase C-terminal domain-containing protein [Pseudonocardia sp. MH-G8]|uniref:FAD-linked oxidase C-terminal domain-containing protein n=1 Tax=Pseudonocardia sp. MH-G8 TaxID=1854588 RepID=UPI0035104329